MKTVVVYFSHTGNNRALAEHLAGRLKADLCPIIEQKRRRWWTILFDMMFQREPLIEPLTVALADYDRVIFVAPVWGSMVASPLKSLIRQQKSALADYSYLTMCGYERPDQKERLTQELTTLVGHPPRAVTELRICDLFPAEKRNSVKTIHRYRVTSNDLDFFAPQIAEFLARTDAVQRAETAVVSPLRN